MTVTKIEIIRSIRLQAINLNCQVLRQLRRNLLLECCEPNGLYWVAFHLEQLDVFLQLLKQVHVLFAEALKYVAIYEGAINAL